jgi:hypothetical protein
LPASIPGGASEIEYKTGSQHDGVEALEQCVEGHPVHEVRVVETGRNVIESSLHVAKYHRLFRTDHVWKHMVKATLLAKRTIKAADPATPLVQIAVE